MAELEPRHSSRLPAYLRIGDLLKNRILSGTYKPNEFLPAERDLAREFSASRQTIRLALESLIRDEMIVPEQGRGTRVVLRRAAPEPTPAVETPAFNLAALIIYGVHREGSAAILQGSQAVMRKADHHLIVSETSSEMPTRAADEASHLRTLIDKRIGGIIIYAEPTDQNRALLAEAIMKGIQVVQIDRYLPGLDCDYVGIDNTAAARDMVRHILTLGHRRIAFLSILPEASSVQERLQGYSLALTDFGMNESDQIVAFSSSFSDPCGELNGIVDKWLAMQSLPTAIFAAHDGLALSIIQMLRERGIRVPADISVVGFDDLYASRMVVPALTTVQQPFKALGETAAHMLIERLSGRYTGPPRKVNLPTKLMMRESSGAVPLAREDAVLAT